LSARTNELQELTKAVSAKRLELSEIIQGRDRRSRLCTHHCAIQDENGKAGGIVVYSQTAQNREVEKTTAKNLKEVKD
jgi:hypothetical protein